MMITFSKSFGKRRRQSRLRFKDDAFPTTRRGFRDAKLLEDGTTHRRCRREERSLDENVVVFVLLVALVVFARARL